MLVFFFHENVTFVEQRCDMIFKINLRSSNYGGKSLALTRNDKYNFTGGAVLEQSSGHPTRPRAEAAGGAAVVAMQF